MLKSRLRMTAEHLHQNDPDIDGSPYSSVALHCLYVGDNDRALLRFLKSSPEMTGSIHRTRT